ncbi:MAG: hypothetical protein V4494_04005 [Chlamydiota bacterium]
MYSGLGTPNSDFIEKRLPPHNDPNLGQLRAQIKKVMIPLLIRIFELKLAAQQANTPPSRLQKKHNEPVEDILSHLKNLEEELRLLQLWCHSCQKQVERALGEIVPTTCASTRFTQKTPENNSKEQPSSNWVNKFLKK